MHMNVSQLMSLTFAEAKHELRMFDSYQRTEAMVYVMWRATTPAEAVGVFLDWGNMCDAPWPWRSMIADILRGARAQISLADVLDLEARNFYDSLLDPVPVWRGCERGRERGLHWTTDRLVAEGFAKGKRCTNNQSTLVQAQIPKQHILAVFVDRNEHEIVLDPRRLRRLTNVGN